ncbi:MAG: glycosyltransferase family 2 protein [Aquabacterium sp.]|nr:glycosyltransferase family 2 protein [Aquabacterium sp.]
MVTVTAVVTAFFWAAIALIVYTYAGYPLWLLVMARLRPQPIKKGAATPEVVVVVVGHNEAHRIEAKIRTCLAQDYPADKLRVLVVSDGSTDVTADIVGAYPDARVGLLACPTRRGKAACLNDSVAHTQAPIIVFTDARQRLHPQAISRLVANFADPAIGAVSGELVFEDDDGTSFADGIGAYWLYEKFIRTREAATGSVVGVTGALYAIRRVCFNPIPTPTILDDVAIPMLAAMQGWRISFESGAIAYDKPSSDASQEKIRKVRTLAGNFQLISLFDGLLLPWRNPLWWRFVSHKMLRLVCPLALLVALLANAVLALNSGFYAALWALQVLGYVTVAAAIRWPVLQRGKVLRLGVTFMHLNVFVVQGWRMHLSQQQAHLWSSSANVDDLKKSARPEKKP